MRLRNAATAMASYMAALLVASTGAVAESGWQPFKDPDNQRSRRGGPPVAAFPPPLAPMGGVLAQPDASQAPRNSDISASGPVASQRPGFGAPYPGSGDQTLYPPPLTSGPAQTSISGKVERLDLEPALATDGSGLTQDAWRGVDVKALEQALAGLTLPPRSAALADLWSRLQSAKIEQPAGGASPAHYAALRLEALYRAGQLDEMGGQLAAAPQGEPIFQAFRIRHALAIGNQATACQIARALMAQRASLPKGLASELHLLSGYCAAAEGNAAGAGLAAELAREANVDAPVALAVLDALAGGGKAGLAVPKLVRVLDYRLLELLGPIDPAQILDKAEPPLLAALAGDEKADPAARGAAAETAARQNIISAEQLAAIYGALAAGADVPTLRRAELVRRASSGSADPATRLQSAKAALDDARKGGVSEPMAQVLALSLQNLQPTAGLEPYGETAAEVFLAGGDLNKARVFASTPAARHWLALIDIADAAPTQARREDNLNALDEMVRRNRLPAPLLHRLATVLDATDVNVPIPLWEAASRTPQPATGALPETGVLGQLQDAAKKKEVARTVLLALRTSNNVEADGIHMIALGDTIRALRRAGLDRDARRFGVEALIRQWPRGSQP